MCFFTTSLWCLDGPPPSRGDVISSIPQAVHRLSGWVAPILPEPQHSHFILLMVNLFVRKEMYHIWTCLSFIQMIRVAWMFYFSKYIELLDTVSSPLRNELIFFGLFIKGVSIYAPPTCLFSTLGIFCAEEKTKPNHISSRVPSLIHAMDMVVGHHLDPRWATSCQLVNSLPALSTEEGFIAMKANIVFCLHKKWMQSYRYSC